MAKCASANFLYVRWQEHSAGLLRVVIQAGKMLQNCHVMMYFITCNAGSRIL